MKKRLKFKTRSLFLTNTRIVLGVSLVIMIFQICISCQGNEASLKNGKIEVSEDEDQPNTDGTSYKLPEIDLSHWKVTLPIGHEGRAIEVAPPEILDYASNETLLPFMYNDSVDGSLVFYTYPGTTTPNSSYSRTELREQMVPGSNTTNWTFAQGGRMKGTLSVPFVSENRDGGQYQTMIMQIHGRLTNEQRDLIGEDDNNAPPVLKIYWNNGKVRVRTKMLKDLNVSDEEMLHTDAWKDDQGHTFSEFVGTEKFTLQVIVSDGRIEVILNDKDSFVSDNVHMEKWGVFENYFKAGNYFISKDQGTSAIVKYYDLKVEH